jgi:glycosyltransferase involved in cell wall biosynthesis
MRILLANDSRADEGGVGTYLSALIRPLEERGHAVALLHDGVDSAQTASRIPIDESWSIGAEGLDGAFERARAWRPDICYSHNMRRLEVDERLASDWPTVKMMHGYFGTCVSGHKAFAFPRVQACSRRCGPACLVHYLPRRCGYRHPAMMLAQYDWATRQRSLFPRYSAIVVASDHMRREYVAHGVEPARVHAIPLFAADSPAPAATDDPTDVVFLGRMTPLKGPDLLVRAVRRASDRTGRAVEVTMAGEGPERRRLEQLAAALGVEARFPGWVDARGRADLLSRAAVVAIPSVWPEPFGLVGLEAAAFGVPAVGFDVGGMSAWLSDEVNGRLLPRSAGADGLGDAIAAILTDPVYRRRLSEGARSIAARFTSDAHVASLERVLEGVRRP